MLCELFCGTQLLVITFCPCHTHNNSSLSVEDVTNVEHSQQPPGPARPSALASAPAMKPAGTGERFLNTDEQVAWRHRCILSYSSTTRAFLSYFVESCNNVIIL